MEEEDIAIVGKTAAEEARRRAISTRFGLNFVPLQVHLSPLRPGPLR